MYADDCHCRRIARGEPILGDVVRQQWMVLRYYRSGWCRSIHVGHVQPGAARDAAVYACGQLRRGAVAEIPDELFASGDPLDDLLQEERQHGG